MKKILFTLCFLSFYLVHAQELPLSSREIRNLAHKKIKLKIDPYEPGPLISNEATDAFGRPYKRVVFSGVYSKSKERTNLGGGALYYYVNSFFSVKTGPSYAKGEGVEKMWKWSLQLSCEYPIFPIK